MEQPDWLVHEYNEDFYILRQSGCTHYEKPFLYLIFGSEKALLLDSGAGKQPGTARIVNSLLERRASVRGSQPSELIVAHSHGHGDHTAGDKEMTSLARVIPPSVDELRQAFGIDAWPDSTGKLDLGTRELDIVPIPGHDNVSIAVYDRRTGILLTGDTVYPGRLYVADMEQFKRSVERLVEWTRTRPVSHLLGAHIEQTRTPFRDYPAGTTFQPGEHALELTRGHLLELHEALATAGAGPIARRDFTIVPKGPRNSNFVPSSFNPPTLYLTSRYKLVPLGPELAQHDYEAYMSSIEHLRTTFSSNGKWPHKNITMADALKDVEGEMARFQSRTAFTYAVLTLDGTRELGCVYIRPSRDKEFDAQVVFWVTGEQLKTGLEPVLLTDIRQWLKSSWPFKNVTFPKR